MFDYLTVAAVRACATCLSASTVFLLTVCLFVQQLIEGRVLCVHGGLSPDLRTIDQIRTIDRRQEIPHEGPFCGTYLLSFFVNLL